MSRVIRQGFFVHCTRPAADLLPADDPVLLRDIGGLADRAHEGVRQSLRIPGGMRWPLRPETINSQKAPRSLATTQRR